MCIHAHTHTCAQSGTKPRPAPQHPSGGSAQPSLGKHGAHPSQAQCQALVTGLALTCALCSYAVLDVQVVVLAPVSIPGERLVARCWHRSSVKSVHGNIALHLFSSLRCCSPVPCWSRAPTRAHPTQFLSVLPCLPWLMMLSPQLLVKARS